MDHHASLPNTKHCHILYINIFATKLSSHSHPFNQNHSLRTRFSSVSRLRFCKYPKNPQTNYLSISYAYSDAQSYQILNLETIGNTAQRQYQPIKPQNYIYLYRKITECIASILSPGGGERYVVCYNHFHTKS